MSLSFSSARSEVTQPVCRSLYKSRDAAGPVGSHYPVSLSSYRSAFPGFDALPGTTEDDQIPGEFFLFFILDFFFPADFVVVVNVFIHEGRRVEIENKYFCVGGTCLGGR